MESAKLGSFIVKEHIAICQFFSKRLDFEHLKLNNQSNKYQGGAPQEESGAAIVIDHFSSMSEDGGHFDDEFFDTIG